MRVVHCISALTLGGAEMMLYKIAARTPESQPLVVAITSDEPMGDRFRAAGIQVIALGKRRGRPDPFAVRRLRDLLRREKPDILQTWMYEANLYGLAAGHLAGVPRIVWNLRCSDMRWNNYTPLSGAAFRLGAWCSGRPDAVIVNSRAGREFHVANGYTGSRMVVIPNGFDMLEFAPRPALRNSFRTEIGATNDTPVIGLVARFDPMKDHRCFIDAAARIAALRTDAHFVLVGSECTWNNATLACLIAARAAGSCWSNRWHLLGRRDDIPRLMAGLDLLALSSITEGFPNVVGEAMACGTPCVVTDVGDAARIVGPTGRSVPPSDPAALAAGILDLLSLEPAGLIELGRNARERINDQYSIEHVASRYMALYDTLLGGTRRLPCVA